MAQSLSLKLLWARILSFILLLCPKHVSPLEDDFEVLIDGEALPRELLYHDSPNLNITLTESGYDREL